SPGWRCPEPYSRPASSRRRSDQVEPVDQVADPDGAHHAGGPPERPALGEQTDRRQRDGDLQEGDAQAHLRAGPQEDVALLLESLRLLLGDLLIVLVADDVRGRDGR